VQGDLVELMGAPVEVGNNLFELAGLSDLLVQVEIPEYQYRFARPGQAVRLYLEAFPYEVFTGQVERLHPRATTREERNVFLAELRLNNSDQKLRPGMKGRAQIAGDAFPLAWKWLHYPYEKARSFVGWF
jgi:multidrug efflux pump subunit AcrA (membrane-fusion protein)